MESSFLSSSLGMTLLIFTEKLHMESAQQTHMLTNTTKQVVKMPIMYLRAIAKRRATYT